jgi:hypothetical protein
MADLPATPVAHLGAGGDDSGVSVAAILVPGRGLVAWPRAVEPLSAHAPPSARAHQRYTRS